MFCSTRTSTLAQRALGALRLSRSFLLLEDDDDVDWEVDRDEHIEAPHPHRAPLRGRFRPRRPGEQPASPQVCISPLQPREERTGCARDRPGPSRAVARRSLHSVS
jgi:hypothetical protein